MTWPQVPLRDLVGEPLRNGRSVKDRAGGFPVLRLTALDGTWADLGQAKAGDWTRDEALPFFVTAGDFLVSRGNGSLRRVAKGSLVAEAPSEVAFPDTMIRVRPRADHLIPKYLAFAWSAPATRAQIESKARTTAGIYKVAQRDLETITLPVPSLSQQQRIVEILEGHLSHLDAGNEAVASAQRRLDALIAAQIEVSLGSAGGNEVALGDLAASLKNGIFVSRPGTTPVGVAILRIGAVRPLVLNLDDLRYSALQVEELTEADALLEAGDLLFTRYNGNPRFVGASAVVDGRRLPLTYPDKLIRLRLHGDRAVPDFVCFATNYGPGRRQIEARLKTSAGQVGISGGELKRVKVRLPGVAEQVRAVAEVRTVMDARERLTICTKVAAQRADSLRRAVLAAAFSGKLTGRHTDREVIEELAAI